MKRGMRKRVRGQWNQWGIKHVKRKGLVEWEGQVMSGNEGTMIQKGVQSRVMEKYLRKRHRCMEQKWKEIDWERVKRVVQKMVQ